MKAVVKVDIEGLNTLERWLNDIVERLPNCEPYGFNAKIYRHLLIEARLLCRRKIAAFDGQKFLRLSFNEGQACAMVHIWRNFSGVDNSPSDSSFLRKVFRIIYQQIV